MTIRQGFSHLLAPLLALGLLLGLATPAQAHKGHAGPMITFTKTKAALKVMLPAGAKITKRKQPLDEEAIEWAENKFGVELDDDLYTYFLAVDRDTKKPLAAAYVGQAHYRHGDLKFAVGLSAEGRITQVAVLGVNEKYVVDFENGPGTGMIHTFAGLTVEEVVARAKELASADKASRELGSAVRDAAVLLAAFLHHASH